MFKETRGGNAWNLMDEARDPNLPIGVREADAIMLELQRLFAYLQMGPKKVCDPHDFVRRLNIQTGMQQDAQEFGKLFTSLVEGLLQLQESPGVKNVVAALFEARKTWITRCLKCGTESLREDLYREIELHILENGTILDSIREQLKEERLDGDNQYFCSTCKSKQDAVRFPQFNTLPPVLNFQLMRFVYDQSVQDKRKIRTAVKFPLTINMKPFVAGTSDTVDDEDAYIYDLTAALMHQGSGTYAGHFIAHIKSEETQKWFSMNDEAVEMLDKPDFDLPDNGSEVKSSTKSRKPKKAKMAAQNGEVDGEPMFTSKVAYMIVYTHRKATKETPI
ncbi:Ubiquitin carboxyl-terminal hydrolase 48, partial [Chytridiales sp. JEL 0842]